MKKLVFVIGIMGNGGAERVIAALSNQLSEQGIAVRIISIYGKRQDYQLNSAIDLQPVLCKNKFRILRPLERIFIIRKLIKDFSPDCVISFLADVNIHTLIAMTKMSIPLIVSERNDPQNDPPKTWVRKMRDIVYKYADGYVFQTPDAKKYFDSIIKNHKKIAIIPNPLTTNLPYHQVHSNNRRLITACRLNKQKNLKMMIDAVAAVLRKGIDCSLDIFGSGPLEDELREYIKTKNLTDHIFLKGFSDNIHEEMQNSAAFLMSSNYEGISNSMLEALAIGVPVIVTDCPVGGARMYISNGENGILIPVNDRKRMTSAIIDVLSNPEKAGLMGKKAIKIREKLDANKISMKWLNFISKVAKN